MARGAKKAPAPSLILEREPHRADGRKAGGSKRRAASQQSSTRLWIPLWLVVQLGIAIAAAAGLSHLVLPSRELDVPTHMLQPAFFQEELLSRSSASALFSLLKRMKEFPTNLNDVQFYKTTHEHIGEAVPLTRNGTCTDPFLVPNSDRTLCVLPGRIDVGRHYALTGGLQGAREPFEWLISRVQSFGRYMFDLTQYPEAATLFDDPKFVKLARQVCPADKQHLDPFQFNFIVQVPGQTVAAHIDGAYFWGATRFQYPQWLLAAMVFSGRFTERFVDQVQVVAYLHEWHPSTRQKQKGAPAADGGGGGGGASDARSGREATAGGGAGEFIHWANGSVPQMELPLPRAGSAIDGSKSVHAAEVYLGATGSPALPLMDKSRRNVLSFQGEEAEDASRPWVLRVDGSEVLQRYSTDDLRVTIVYRARCFHDAAEAERFGGNGGPADQQLSLDEILHTLGKSPPPLPTPCRYAS